MTNVIELRTAQPKRPGEMSIWTKFRKSQSALALLVATSAILGFWISRAWLVDPRAEVERFIRADETIRSHLGAVSSITPQPITERGCAI